MRNLSNPSAGSTIVGLFDGSAGGTGENSPSKAIVAISAIPRFQLNTVNGVAQSDDNGLIRIENIPQESVSLISIKGLTTLMKGVESQYVITNYDSFTDYDIQCVTGSVAVFEDIITYTAPLTVGTAGFTVNGRPYNIIITDTVPVTPSITSPTAGAALLDLSYTLTGSAFNTVDGGSSHASSDWQIATDSNFTTIVKSTIDDTVNKTSWPVTELANKTVYFARVRYKSTSNVYSAYSATISFSINVVGASVYSAVARTGTGTTGSTNQASFAPDVMIAKRRTAGAGTAVYDKLRGPTNLLLLNSTAAESTGANKGVISFDNNGVTFGSASDGTINQSGISEILYFFKKFDSIFDLTQFSTAAVAHTLGVTPEFIISKDRNNAPTPWNVFCKPKASNNIISSGITLNSISVTNEGTAYTATPTVSFSGGGGTGAAATANMVSDGTVQKQTGTVWSVGPSGYDKFIGYDYTSLPTLGTWSGANILTNPANALASFVTLYDYSDNAPQIFYNGSSVPDGTYTASGANPLIGSLIAPVLQITVAGGVVTSTNLTGLGLTAASNNTAFFYYNHPTLANSGVNIRVSAVTVSPRKGVSIFANNGTASAQTIAYLSYSGGGGNGSGSQGFDMQTQQPVYTTVPAYKVNTITLTNPGSGYTSNPIISISGDGYNAAATVNSTPFNINTPTTPVVTKMVLNGTAATTNTFFTDEPTNSQFNTSVGASDKVVAVSVVNGGANYTSAPTVSLTGGGGTGAAATAILVAGSVASISVTSQGSGYTAAPTATLSGGSGSGASATALLGNGSNSNYIAYMLATFDDVSKVFSYRGNGGNLDIDCGFTGGAKFIFIVRSDGVGDRYVWDATRGITNANDPHISLNDTTSAEVTTDDSIGLLNIGFTAKQNSATNINILNANYIGFAFA